MFTEILRIVLRLDQAAAAKMEQTLSNRFTKVAKTFGQGLKAIVKSSVLGIGLSLLASLLNPLQELEERIKKLLGQGDDLNDQADKYGTTPGQLKTLENIAGLQGVTPEKLSKLMESFVAGIETAKTELEAQALDPTKALSATTEALKNFTTATDQAENFFKYLQSLRTFGNEAGTEARSDVEKLVFGERLYGANRRFLEADPAKELARLSKGPSPQAIDSATEKLASLSRLGDAKRIVNETSDYVQSSGKLTPSIISQMEQRAKEEATRNRNEIDQYNNLAKAAASLQMLTNLANDLKNKVIECLGALTTIVGYLKDFLPSLPTLPSVSSLGKSWLNWIGGDGMPTPKDKK